MKNQKYKLLKTLLKYNISKIKIRIADLSGANLSGANLSKADLSGADLSDIKISEYTFGITINCPEEGSFIAWKKCYENIIVKLFIPEDAKRSSATTYKCRASKAIVLDIEGAEIAYSAYNHYFTYEKGKIIEIDDFDENRWNECSTGIHFFMNKQLAINY